MNCKSLGIICLAVGGLCLKAPAVTLTHSLSQTIDPSASIACFDPGSGTTVENRFLRSFDLTSFVGPGNPFNVTSLDIAISEINADFPLDLNIYLDTDGGAPTSYAGDLSLLSTTNVVIHSSDAASIVNVPVSQLVPAGSFMVVEAHYGSVAQGAALFLGANSLGQTGPTYVASVDCGIPDPLDLAAIGFPNTHGIMNVVGNVVPEPASFLLLFLPALFLRRSCQRPNR